MDEAIRKLKSTTFFGRRLTRRQIAAIQQTVHDCPGLSRNELGRTLCEHLDWRTEKGEDRIQAALRLLERLQEWGVLTLPEKQGRRRGPNRRPAWGARSEPETPVEGALSERTPLQLEVVRDPAAVAEWNELVDRHHYLGYRHPVGPALRYLVRDRHGRRLACLLFQFAAPKLACREAFIGWDAKARARRLSWVLGQSRFLILPWVRVPNLASKALAQVTGRLAEDWKEAHGYRPVLVETFVDPGRFDGACYRAANWQCLGETRGRGAARARKKVFVCPLDPEFRALLVEGRRPRRRVAPSPKADFVAGWPPLIEALEARARECDRRWQKRQRTLNTLLVALFVFRLVRAPARTGYGPVLSELWAQCRSLGIPLPQDRPVTPAAACRARAKLPEDLFRQLHAEVLQRGEADEPAHLWKGHRLFAVDGSKLNLPRQLADHGYPVPAPNAHYPQGLLSCLYRLRTRIPVDFDLHRHADERRAARAHLTHLAAGDVVVYDRGYFSLALLREHLERDLNAVFRLRVNAAREVAAFVQSEATDREVRLGGDRLPLRLVKYRIGGADYLLGTTLHSRRKYPIAELADLYHERWGIEELFKSSKQTVGIEGFHSHSERGVKQELFAHYVLLTLARQFANHGEDRLNASPTPQTPPRQAHFGQALAVVARNLEALCLRQAERVGETVRQMFTEIAGPWQGPPPPRPPPPPPPAQAGGQVEARENGPGHGLGRLIQCPA